MSWLAAMGAGVGLGLAYFGGLWLTVVIVVCRSSRPAWVPISGVVRLALLWVGLAAVSRHDAGNVVAALGGLWLSRWYLVQRLGSIQHGG